MRAVLRASKCRSPRNCSWKKGEQSPGREEFQGPHGCALDVGDGGGMRDDVALCPGALGWVYGEDMRPILVVCWKSFMGRIDLFGNQNVTN